MVNPSNMKIFLTKVINIVVFTMGKLEKEGKVGVLPIIISFYKFADEK